MLTNHAESLNTTIMGPQHDGLVCTPYREGVLVSGGLSLRHIWRFSFRTLEWSLLRTQGQFAPCGRVYHTASMWGDSLIVSGGITPEDEDFLSVYRLDMTSLRWSRIVTNFPEEGMSKPPLPRSHHASMVMGDNLYLHGGKPVEAGYTTSDYRQLHSQGFFDILILHLPSGSWTRKAHVLPQEYVPAPSLWGHTMIGLDDNSIILFGGFEIDLAIATGAASYATREDFEYHLKLNAAVDAPAAELQNVMNVFSLRTSRWSVFAPDVMIRGPTPRALHTAQMLRNREMIVIGGISVSDADGSITPASDAWVWSSATGTWRQLDPFPIPPFRASEPHRFQGARVFSTIYNDQLVVTNDMTTWYVLDTTHPVEFGGSEAEYFFCACVDVEDWQVVTNPFPQPHNNPLAQNSLDELTCILHPRRNLFQYEAASHHSGLRFAASEPAEKQNHLPPLISRLPSVTSQSGFPFDEWREKAAREYQAMISDSRGRTGGINPVIADMVDERS